MSWGKGLIIFLGLMQLSHVAHARDIESFTDSQGTLHITNAGPKQQGSPANPPSPAAPLRPSSLPRKAPIALPAREPAPQAQAPAPKPEAPAPVPNSEAQAPAPQPEAAPGEPVPVDPQPGSRVTHPEGSGGVMPLADRTGKKAGPEAAAETPAAQLQRVSWSPPQPVMPSSEGKIVIRRDRQGVIHITNVALDEAPLIAPATPTPAVQKQARPPRRFFRPCMRCRVRSWDRRLRPTLKPSSRVTPRSGLAKPFAATGTPKASGISSTHRPRTCSHPRLR